MSEYTYKLSFDIGNISVIALKIEKLLPSPNGLTANEGVVTIIYKEDLTKEEQVILDTIMADVEVGVPPIEDKGTGNSVYAIDDVLDNRKEFISQLGFNVDMYPAEAPDSRTYLVFDRALSKEEDEALKTVFISLLKSIK